MEFRRGKREGREGREGRDGRDGREGRGFNGVSVGGRERDRKGSGDDVFMNINLIRQNNRLI